MEEAAFMSAEMFSKIVVPLLGVEKTAVLAISTPDDEYNYYTNLMNVMVDGKPLFKTIRITQSCSTCIAAGLPCTHPQNRLPPWKPIGRLDKIAAIMKNMPELNARENLGQVISTKQFMIQSMWLQKLGEMERHQFRGSGPGVIHIGIDPSGGGQASDYAIASVAYDNAKYVILGSDASGSHRWNDVLMMLDEHIMKLRTMPEYRDAVLWIYIEANMSFISADELGRHFEDNQHQFGRVVVARHDPKNLGRTGVWTGEKEKELYAKHLQKLLSDGLIRYAESFVTVTKNTAAEAKAQLEEQIRNLRKEAKPVLEPGFDKVKYTYTAKANGVRDDASMALQIALHNMHLIRTDEHFRDVCANAGLNH